MRMWERTVVLIAVLTSALSVSGRAQELSCGVPGVFVEVVLRGNEGIGWSRAIALAQGILLGTWVNERWPSGPSNTSKARQELCYSAELIQELRGIAFVRVISGFKIRGQPAAGSHEVIVAFTAEDAAIVPLVPADTATRWKVPSPDVINALMARQPVPEQEAARWAERRSLAALIFGQNRLEPHFTATECPDRDALLLARSFEGRASYYDFSFDADGSLKELSEVTNRPRC